jgi:hypothetical protein
LGCRLPLDQAQLQAAGAAGARGEQRPPHKLEQLRPIDLLPAALPRQQLRHALVSVEGPVDEGRDLVNGVSLWNRVGWWRHGVRQHMVLSMR